MPRRVWLALWVLLIGAGIVPNAGCRSAPTASPLPFDCPTGAPEPEGNFVSLEASGFEFGYTEPCRAPERTLVLVSSDADDPRIADELTSDRPLVAIGLHEEGRRLAMLEPGIGLVAWSPAPGRETSDAMGRPASIAGEPRALALDGSFAHVITQLDDGHDHLWFELAADAQDPSAPEQRLAVHHRGFFHGLHPMRDLAGRQWLAEVSASLDPTRPADMGPAQSVRLTAWQRGLPAQATAEVELPARFREIEGRGDLIVFHRPSFDAPRDGGPAQVTKVLGAAWLGAGGQWRLSANTLAIDGDFSAIAAAPDGLTVASGGRASIAAGRDATTTARSQWRGMSLSPYRWRLLPVTRDGEDRLHLGAPCAADTDWPSAFAFGATLATAHTAVTPLLHADATQLLSLRKGECVRSQRAGRVTLREHRGLWFELAPNEDRSRLKVTALGDDLRQTAPPASRTTHRSIELDGCVPESSRAFDHPTRPDASVLALPCDTEQRTTRLLVGTATGLEPAGQLEGRLLTLTPDGNALTQTASDLRSYLIRDPQNPRLLAEMPAARHFEEGALLAHAIGRVARRRHDSAEHLQAEVAPRDASTPWRDGVPLGAQSRATFSPGTGIQVYGLGTLAIVAQSTWQQSTHRCRFDIWDASDPRRPRKLSGIDAPKLCDEHRSLDEHRVLKAPDALVFERVERTYGVPSSLPGNYTHPLGASDVRTRRLAFFLLDLHDPERPAFHGAFRSPAGTWAERVFQDGAKLVIATKDSVEVGHHPSRGTHSLQVLDLTDPRRPRLGKRIAVPGQPLALRAGELLTLRHPPGTTAAALLHVRFRGCAAEIVRSLPVSPGLPIGAVFLADDRALLATGRIEDVGSPLYCNRKRTTLRIAELSTGRWLSEVEAEGILRPEHVQSDAVWLSADRGAYRLDVANPGRPILTHAGDRLLDWHGDAVLVRSNEVLNVLDRHPR